MLGFKEFLDEGVNDPAIFKAVFLAGGPGSGKSFIVKQTALASMGFRLVNSDPAFEKALEKAGLTMDPSDIASDAGQAARAKAKDLTKKQMKFYLDGRLGLIIDGTGKDYNKIEKQVSLLRTMGYSVKMIFVNTDLDTAISRNRARSRSLPDEMVTAMWKGVQKNIGKFQNLFRNRMIVIDNSDGSNYEGAVKSAFVQLKKWAKEPVKNGIAQKWIDAAKK
jgi:predicted ABC-type ATPase